MGGEGQREGLLFRALCLICAYRRPNSLWQRLSALVPPVHAGRHQLHLVLHALELEL